MANPLTLIMPLNPGTTLPEVEEFLLKYLASVEKALAKLMTVHYARIIVLDRSVPNMQPSGTSAAPYSLALITEYDGDFNPYVQSFVSEIPDFFDAMMALAVGGNALIPVIEHIPEFQLYVAHNDASQHPPNQGVIEAYPYTVTVIIADCQS